MQLTKLEIKGFKSFGDKVSFNFDKGVTAIVGPNGSGKSNVVDAIRWVLGEQSSRALRSDKMENVIFNGTSKRRQQQMAEVSLVFKNTRNLLPTEYAEVMISRRYYRSGDSEYLLNGVTCRLKDISNLFMDTGISSDSYAIIELKMIDEILNDQNQSRRGLFEEAAGVSKFKKRKKESLKKLEDTQADLERVEDLLHEIEKNMRSLERQAKQAERYLKLREQYKEKSLLLAAKSIERFLRTEQEMIGTIEGLDAKKSENVAKQRQVEAQIEELKLGISAKEQLLNSRQKTLNQHVGKIRQFESDKKIKNERLKFLNQRAAVLQQQIEEDRKSNERASFSIESLRKEEAQLDKMLRETTYLLEGYRKERESQQERTAALKKQAQEVQVQARNHRDALYQLKKTLEINQVQESSFKQELESEQYESSEKTANLEDFDHRIAEVSEELAQQEAAFEKLKRQKEEATQQLQSGEAAQKSLADELAKANRQLDAWRNEFNLTKSMLDNLEGYPQAIKFLKKNTAWGKQASLLSDIIAAEEKYRLCIENYLEPFLNHFVVATEAQAMEAVNLLSDAAKGRAHFLVLEKFKKFSPRPLKQFEDARPAVSLLEFDEAYRFLVHYLLDGVYVVTGKQESLPPDPEATFVTQNGKIIRRKYSVSGGSVGLFEGKKMGRARNIEKLSGKIRKMEHKVQEIERALEDKKADTAFWKGEVPGPEMEDLRETVGLLRQEMATIKTRKEQFLELLQDKEHKRERLLEKLDQVRQVMEATRPKVSETEEKAQIVEEQLLELQDQLEQEQAQLNQKSTAFNEQNLLYHQQGNRLESLRNEIAYKETSFSKGKARLENNRQDLGHIEKEIAGLVTSSGENEDQLVALYEEKQSIEAAVNEAEREYYQIRGEISELEKQGTELRRQKEQVEQLLLEAKEKMAQVKVEIKSVRDRVEIEFNAQLSDVPITPDELAAIKEGELQQEVVKVREKIDKIGPVNHTAIDAYNEVKERHAFITEQKNDLLEAITSLNTTIGEIDKVARENFLEAFHNIRDNFQRVFRSLFTESDSCDLILSDSDDPLNSKIEIMARPKGKRPLTINQLSGGEKTLTATALLFAIYLLKPAPFCIFDEVDAPLDDANIDKFNNIIKKFSEKSQFIVVTHNKRTMASTDIIYGVTMVEQGVSTVVPVDLRTVDENMVGG